MRESREACGEIFFEPGLDQVVCGEKVVAGFEAGACRALGRGFALRRMLPQLFCSAQMIYHCPLAICATRVCRRALTDSRSMRIDAPLTGGRNAEPARLFLRRTEFRHMEPIDCI
jgi:hypothetical protein